MNDLRNQLNELAGAPTAPSLDQVEADVLRGRRALRRRRVGQGVAASVLAAAAAVSVFAAVSGSPGATARTATSAGSTATSTADSTGAVRLVAYTGTQPKGFILDEVPDGWFIQSDDNFSLLLAPKRVQNPSPGVDPSKDPIYDKQSFVGKIGITLESKDQHGPSRQGTTVTVGDKQGMLVKSLPGVRPGQPRQDPTGDTGWMLWVKQPAGPYLIIQFWQGLGLSQDQMVELGAGVHVLKDAMQGAG
jgi:hypothetical protein